MIKLQRSKKPKYLTNEKVKELTEEFKKDTNKTVWKNRNIADELLKSSSFKCAYCECQLNIEDSYMQVEHFKDKDRYPDDVVNWDNLLPSCGRCNRKKWTLDVVAFPIINPYIDEPKMHLCHESFRLYGKDNKGKMTIKKLVLNDDERVVYPRFLAINELKKQLEEIRDNINNSDWARNKLTNLLLSSQSNKSYSAFISSELHRSIDYEFILNDFKNKGLFDEDLEILHNDSLNLTIDSR